MTLAQVLNAFAGSNEKEANRSKVIWESQRWSTFMLWNIQVDKKHKKKYPMQLLRFPWEQAIKLTKEEKEEFKRRADKFPKKLKNGNK